MSNFTKLIEARMAKTGESYQSAQRHVVKAGGGGGAEKPPQPPEDPPGFAGRISRLLRLAEAEAVEAAKEAKSYMGPDGTVRLSDVPLSDGPAYWALRNAVDEFDEADTRKLEAFMYSGREGVSLRTMHRQLTIDKTEHARAQVVSKRGPALVSYLRRALEQARLAGVDLDAPLPDRSLLRALSAAGISDESLDKWNPALLSLHQINYAQGADAEIVARTARENADKGNFALDLGHEAIGISRAAGETLERYLTENAVPFERRRLALEYQRLRTDKRGAHQRFVVDCLRWPATYHDQNVQQLWQFAQRAGVQASVADITVAAEKLARGGVITQKTGPSSDCFWVTEEQLRALGGAKKPTWAVPSVLVREVHPGTNRRPEHTLPASSETPCTLAPKGTDPSDLMTLDHLTPRGDGRLYAYDADSEPWPGAILTLADCKVGDLVYLNRSNWVASPAYWTLYEIVPPDVE